MEPRLYFTAFDALEPVDFGLLQNGSGEARLQRGIDARAPRSDNIADSFVNLWLAGCWIDDELKAVINQVSPDDDAKSLI